MVNHWKSALKLYEKEYPTWLNRKHGFASIRRISHKVIPNNEVGQKTRYDNHKERVKIRKRLDKLWKKELKSRWEFTNGVSV